MLLKTVDIAQNAGRQAREKTDIRAVDNDTVAPHTVTDSNTRNATNNCAQALERVKNTQKLLYSKSDAFKFLF